MQMNGLDGMRYLGADPTRPADEAEREVMVLLNNMVVIEQKALSAREG